MRVLCTNGLKTVMLDLAPEFERAIGTKAVITWGSANGLLQELEAGAGGDLAILTAEAIDGLIKEGKVVAGSRVDLARSGIGVAVRKGAPKPDIGSSDALRRALVAAKGGAEIGVQQISELLPVAGIEIVGPLPAALQRITIFSAGVLTAAKEPEAARALVQFVATASRPLLKDKGLEPA
jgi:molybdate transport system substrate-binding protein